MRLWLIFAWTSRRFLLVWRSRRLCLIYFFWWLKTKIQAANSTYLWFLIIIVAAILIVAVYPAFHVVRFILDTEFQSLLMTKGLCIFSIVTRPSMTSATLSMSLLALALLVIRLAHSRWLRNRYQRLFEFLFLFLHRRSLTQYEVIHLL